MMHDLADFNLQTYQVTVCDLYEIKNNFGDRVFNTELYNKTSDFEKSKEECIYEIIKYLSIDYNCYTNINVIDMANLTRYKIRINLWPLIKKGKEVLNGNEMCLEDCNLWVRYFNNGDNPCQIDLPKSILREVKARHKDKDLKLEKIS